MNVIKVTQYRLGAVKEGKKGPGPRGVAVLPLLRCVVNDGLCPDNRRLHEFS